MGCLSSKEEDVREGQQQGEVVNSAGQTRHNKRTSVYSRPVWKSEEHLTLEEIKV